jgi:hypothetical protein
LKLFGAWAPHSLDAIKEVLEEDLQDRVSEEVEDYSAVLGYEELGDLSGIDPLGTARKLPVRKKKSDSY